MKKESITTYPFKIKDPNRSSVQDIKWLFSNYRKAVNFAIQEIHKLDCGGIDSVKHNSGNGRVKSIYDQMGEIYDFTAQTRINALSFANEQYKSFYENKNNTTFPQFKKPVPVRLNTQEVDTFTTGGDNFMVSISFRSNGQGVKSDQITVPIQGQPKKERQYKNDQDVYGFKLMWNNDGFYLNFIEKKEVEVKEPLECEHFIGVDINLNNIAVAVKMDRSGKILDEQFFNGRQMLEKKKHYQQKKQEFQQKGLHDKAWEFDHKRKRYMDSMNHEISSKIVDMIDEDVPTCVVMEDLKGIPSSNMGKKMNWMMSSWGRGGLRDKTSYKTFEKGALFLQVPSPFTSLYCYHCKSVSLDRDRGSSSANDIAVCKNCGREVNADKFASVNIVQRLWSLERDHNWGNTDIARDPDNIEIQGCREEPEKWFLDSLDGVDREGS